MRIHGTTRCRPAEAFVASEQALLLAGADRPLRRAGVLDPQGPPGPPRRGGAGHLLGARQPDRPDLVARPTQAVKLFAKGQLIKVHPRQAPGRPLHRPRGPPDRAPSLRPA